MKGEGQNRRHEALILALVALVIFLVMPECSFAAPGYEDVASSSDMAKAKRVAKYGMVPVYAKDVKDGEYSVTTDSSSSFFNIVDTKLTVKKNKMTAEIQIASSSYKCVYPGTAEEAAKAPLKEYIMAEEADMGTSFTIPVEALNKEMNLAAYSKRKKKYSI